MKILKYALLFSIFFIGVVLITGLVYYKIKTSPAGIGRFIKNNSQRASLFYTVNGKEVIKISETRKISLASTLKWMVLLQYCLTVDKDKLLPSKKISLSEIDKYYLPNSDGGAHQAWLSELRTQYPKGADSVTIRDIVSGMMKQSSNANSEFLMDYLGLDSINNTISSLNINHDKLTYLTSFTYFILKEDTNYIKSLSYETLLLKIDSIHQQLKNGKIKLNADYELTMEQTHLMNVLMTKSTTQSYSVLMQKLNRKEIGGSAFQKEMDTIFQYIMKIKGNDSFLSKMGAKGGSTIEVLTFSCFAQKTNGDYVELVCFIQDLDVIEYFIYKNALNKFYGSLIRNNDDGKKIIRILQNKN
jgi:D-alanyl-D-alanine carboxypeptidase